MKDQTETFKSNLSLSLCKQDLEMDGWMDGWMETERKEKICWV